MLFLYLTAHSSSDLCKSNTGLGNVLFQLAFQYCVSKKYNIKPNYFHLSQFIKKLESFGLTNYDTTIYRNFHNIDKGIVSSIDLIFSERKKAHIYDEQLISNIIKHRNENMLIKNSYLQSIKYFDEYEKEIQELFSPDYKSLKIIYNKYPQIQNDKVINVAIHLRLEWGASLTYKPEYYKNSIKFIENKFNNSNTTINYFVFSDNINKAKSILSRLNGPFIYCENNPDYIDLWIMSLCCHNIICHSTLGWWGAYLNKKSDKCVLYPSDVLTFFCRKVLRRGNIKEIQNNIYPENWICINSKSLCKSK